MAISIRLKRCKRCEKINRFENAGLALRVIPDEQDHAPRQVDVEAGEVAKVGEGKMFEMHGVLMSLRGLKARSNLLIRDEIVTLIERSSFVAM